jgi:hypothetical protein
MGAVEWFGGQCMCGIGVGLFGVVLGDDSLSCIPFVRALAAYSREMVRNWRKVRVWGVLVAV